MRRVALVLVLVMLTVGAAPAAAQSPMDPDRTQSIGVGVLWSPAHIGRGGTPGVEAAWRRWLSPHLGIAADVRWGVRNKTARIDSPEQPGPGGITIRAQQGVEHLRTTSQAYGGGVVARTTPGRLSLVGGVGPALFVERLAHQTRINDVADRGQSTARSVGVLGLIEVEVRATRALSAFAALRVELRDARDSESTLGSPAVGVRFAF